MFHVYIYIHMDPVHSPLGNYVKVSRVRLRVCGLGHLGPGLSGSGFHSAATCLPRLSLGVLYFNTFFRNGTIMK